MKIQLLILAAFAVFLPGILPAEEPVTTNGGAADKAAQEVSVSPTPASAASPAPSPTAAKAPIDLFEQTDYDEDKDVFYVRGTKEPYNGPVFSNYDNGTPELTGTLKNGHEEGLWTQYFEDGKKDSEGMYIQGSETGEWTFWHENGQIASKGNYKNGSPDGKWVTFFENGNPDSEGVYVEGVMDGPWKFYDEKTGEAHIIKFDRGVQLKR